jgi:hypothetical protein
MEGKGRNLSHGEAAQAEEQDTSNEGAKDHGNPCF